MRIGVKTELWRWDREFGPFERLLSSGPVACSRGLEAAGGQTGRRILREEEEPQRGMRNEGEVWRALGLGHV